jgi:alpha-L-fucosidase
MQGVDWGRSTMRGSTVYMHVFDWPANGQIVVTAINLPLRQTGETSVILGPIDPPESIDTVLALETDQEGTVT